MHILHDMPIKHKLTIISMLTSVVALLLACLALAAYEQINFRQTTQRDFSILADMFDDNVASGLAFNDADSMELTLKTLSANPHVLAAAVYDKEGKVAANYQRNGPLQKFPFPPVQPTGSVFRKDRLDTFQKITLTGEDIGTFYVASDLNEFGARLKRYALIMSVVLLASSAVAFGLSANLRKIISEPISQLAEVAHLVATKKNYSVRAEKQSEDELGQLIDNFNEMLSQIQQRDSALEAARDKLEQRVEERTGELANSLSLLNATLDSTTDGVLAIQFTGEVVCSNSRFAMMWEVPEGLLEKGKDAEFIAYSASQVKDSEKFLQRIKELHQSPDTEAFDVIELKNGKIFERYVKPQSIHGQTVGIVINFRDITARKRAEAELENIHKQLLDTSRRAGMAEVATTVLHNVGNVLNSVNVSCSVISSKVTKSSIGNVARTSLLLREHANDLPGFFTNDPMGLGLSDFLGKLSEQLTREQASVLEELQTLSNNIDHIKDIVSMQQNYGKVSGVTETLAVTDLVEDSLRLNASALTRHDVQLVCDYDDGPPITVEKHKVLQILVNLIRNAKHACDDSARTDKQITMRVIHSQGSVQIAVIDNGVGISPDDLTRIFSHGFTTRKDGHGFGLHGSILTAREMGGNLTVHSNGTGKGATFTLELPLNSGGNN